MTDAKDDAKDAAGTAAHRRRNERVGVVVKAKMQKTVVVAVERLVRHDMYRKTIKRTSTFMAHDEKGAKLGDTVRIVETRPLSKNKRWRVEEILGQGTGVEDTASEVRA
jgi:small subunit ribosomal protein S17